MPARRQLVQTSAALGMLAAAAHGKEQPTLRVGLVGCGGRGTGAASQALRADPNVKLVAMADAFADRLTRSLGILNADEPIKDKIDVPENRRFVGFDACERLLDSGVDVVLLCSPPGFRPQHIRLAVDKNVHIFAEKPIAVDAPGVRSVIASCADAARKNLAVVSGLCLRYSNHYRAMMSRLHDGWIGDVLTIQANDLRGRIWMFPREDAWTDMEWQMRNWYYFTWLSGDFNVEQHVHNLDVAAWVMKDTYPVKAIGLGGRQARTSPEYGHIYDHISVTYEYASGVKLFSHTRQQTACANDVTVYALGTQGSAYISERKMEIRGYRPWRETSRDNPFYQKEHDELFASIRSGRPINNADYMCKSTLLGIMGRMAAYTGKAVTWDQAMASTENLMPATLQWGPMPTPTPAMPGVTELR